MSNTNMKRKSKDNFEAAELLQQNGFYNTSIHAFYYSCFQRLIYFVKTKLNISNRTINQGTNNRGSHNYYIDMIFSDCNKNRNLEYRKCVLLKDNIKELKNIRKKADYKEKFITQAKSIEAKGIAEEIFNLLKEAYGE